MPSPSRGRPGLGGHGAVSLVRQRFVLSLSVFRRACLEIVGPGRSRAEVVGATGLGDGAVDRDDDAVDAEADTSLPVAEK